MIFHELMGAHRYAEVATACEEGLRGSPDDEVLLAWHAHAMLCLGQLPEALAQYRRLDERERASRFRSDSRIKDIGGILWMLGRPQEAIETFQATIDGIGQGADIVPRPAEGAHHREVAPGSPCVLDRGAADQVAIYKAVERGELRSLRVSRKETGPRRVPAPQWSRSAQRSTFTLTDDSGYFAAPLCFLS